MNKNSNDWHRADIVAALKKQGWSMSALGEAYGLGKDTLRSALTKPYLKAERIIAGAIGVDPEIIWPSRYEARNFKPQLKKVVNA